MRALHIAVLRSDLNSACTLGFLAVWPPSNFSLPASSRAASISWPIFWHMLKERSASQVAASATQRAGAWLWADEACDQDHDRAQTRGPVLCRPAGTTLAVGLHSLWLRLLLCQHRCCTPFRHCRYFHQDDSTLLSVCRCLCAATLDQVVLAPRK